jgi:hypothetical protein
VLSISTSVSTARRLVWLGLALGLAACLRSCGWGAGLEATGTLTLYPPAGLPATPPAGTAPGRVAAPWEPEIRAALTRRGWDLRRDAAGKLPLMPTGLGLFSA